MEFLGITRGAFQAHLNSTNRAPAEKTTVGAAILRLNSAGKREILLLKRNANETYFPNMYEIPGGKVDDNDASIEAGLAREVAEETHLTTTAVLSALLPFHYTTQKKIQDLSSGQEKVIRRSVVQLSYVVSIEGDGAEFQVNEWEHSTGGWFDANAAREVPMTREMRNLVSQALEKTTVE